MRKRSVAFHLQRKKSEHTDLNTILYCCNDFLKSSPVLSMLLISQRVDCVIRSNVASLSFFQV